jgi:hypothetical protein
MDAQGNTAHKIPIFAGGIQAQSGVRQEARGAASQATPRLDETDLDELTRIIHERSWRGRQMCVRSGRTQQ